MKINKLKIKTRTVLKKLPQGLSLKKKTQGYAILELLFYISILATVSLLVINSMMNMALFFKETSIYGQLVQNGNIMERMSREIRTANDISFINVTDLKLNTKNDAGADKTVEFTLSGVNLQLFENDVLIGNLNTPNIMVTDLSFTQITTMKGKAVKIFMTVRVTNDKLNRTFDFYDTVVLRGLY